MSCDTEGHKWEVIKGEFLNPDPDDFTRVWLLKCQVCGKERPSK